MVLNFASTKDIYAPMLNISDELRSLDTSNALDIELGTASSSSVATQAVINSFDIATNLRRIFSHQGTFVESTRTPQINNTGEDDLNNSPVNLPSDFFGDKDSTAYNIGEISGSYDFTWDGAIGGGNTNDFFRFSLGNSSDIRISLSELSADADIRLLNSNGTVITSSTNSGSQNESIIRTLSAGSYLVQIYPYNNAVTNYRLKLTGSGTATDPGSAISSSRDLGEVSRSWRTWNDFVGSNDPTDYFRFELRESTTLNLAVSGLSSDADVRLMDIGGTEIARSQNSGAANELINRVLKPGSYYVEVYRYTTNVNTNYSLRLDGTQYINSNPNFNNTYGYGLVNAAAAVAGAINQTPFASVPDLGGNNWGNDLVNAPEAWNRGFTGQGVVVAVIDDGVDITHPDLQGNIWRNSRGEIAENGIDDDGNGYIDDINGWNFAGTGNNNVMPTQAQATHGTHVAGTIAALNNEFGVTGVAYNAQIMPVRIADTTSDGRWTNFGNLATAIRYAVDNGARVINMSLSWTDSVALRDALAYAANRNVIVLTAAGNDQLDSPGSPGYYGIDYGLTVGAVNSQSQIASFSNRASSDSRMQQVVAPGVNIYSTVPNNQYSFKNGTSMATPHVAGVVALMLSANPNLTHDQVRQILTSTATRLS